MNIPRNKTCKHNYKNAIQVGNVDYMCPLCKKLLDPLEWFLMNNFKFVDVEGKIVKKKKIVDNGNYLNSKRVINKPKDRKK
ncbi:MAG TPA: hypothetical protein P5323_03535 [Candidatus Moranbacteria bacterium]|nr:hypothetical protein [Candidatus Moranbacteria bacterium]HRY28184.1 hypothetical protein [Candidatus Moranbacteria bacterium]HSA08295.1 hypothetical protein [Candidatus Moranbacteria bacterium]